MAKPVSLSDIQELIRQATATPGVVAPVSAKVVAAPVAAKAVAVQGESLERQIERLRAENAALLKAKAVARAATMKVTDKGGVSFYGTGRFPITLYKSQWAVLLEHTEEIREFLRANDALLAVKE